MRFSYLVLAAAVVLLAGSSQVSAAGQKNIGKVTSADTAASVRALAADGESKRHLRADTSVDKKDDENAKDDGEEKGLFDYLVDRYAAKTTYRGWYRSRMTPKEVKRMLRNREAEGRYVDWDLADGYEVYYYRRKHSLFYD